jgi:hypothetical protein
LRVIDAVRGHLTSRPDAISNLQANFPEYF